MIIRLGDPTVRRSSTSAVRALARYSLSELVWFPVGKGEVVVTTLESHAWLEPGSESQEMLLQTDFKSSVWAKPLVDEAFAGKPIPTQAEELDYALEFIGSPVLPRRWVMLTLGGFVVTLVGVGLFFIRTSDSRAIGLWAPLLSIAVGAALCAGSSFIRRDKVDTVATVFAAGQSEKRTAREIAKDSEGNSVAILNHWAPAWPKPSARAP